MRDSLETPDGCIVAYAHRLGHQDKSGAEQGSSQPRLKPEGLDAYGERRRVDLRFCCALLDVVMVRHGVVAVPNGGGSPRRIAQ